MAPEKRQQDIDLKQSIGRTLFIVKIDLFEKKKKKNSNSFLLFFHFSPLPVPTTAATGLKPLTLGRWGKCSTTVPTPLANRKYKSLNNILSVGGERSTLRIKTLNLFQTADNATPTPPYPLEVDIFLTTICDDCQWHFETSSFYSVELFYFIIQNVLAYLVLSTAMAIVATKSFLTLVKSFGMNWSKTCTITLFTDVI